MSRTHNMKGIVRDREWEIIKLAVDRAVHMTGFPVTYPVLAKIDVTKEQVRRLAYDGRLSEVEILIKGTGIIKGYYVTGGIYPDKMLEQDKQELQPEE